MSTPSASPEVTARASGVWKWTTLLFAGASVYLALFPLRSAGRGATDTAQGVSPRQARDAKSGAAGARSQDGDGAGPSPLEQLRAARTPGAICRALAQLGNDADSSDAAAELLFQPRLQVRQCAAGALARMRDTNAIGALKKAVADRDPYVRRIAMEAVARSDNPADRERILALAEKGQGEPRIDALLALARAQRPEALPLLLAAVQGTTGSAQRELVSALGQTRDPQVIPILVQLTKTAGLQVRSAAFSALGQIGGEAAVEILRNVLLAEEGGRRDDVNSAAYALAQIDDGPAHEALIQAAESPRRHVAEAAINALGGIEGDDVRELMGRLLGSLDDGLAASACHYFARHHDDSAVPKLVALAQKGRMRSASSAVNALAQNGGEQARAALLALARESGPAQAMALSSLGQVPGLEGEARKLMLRALEEGGDKAQRVIWQLGEDSSPEARRALLEAVRTGGNLAHQAADILGRNGDPAALAALADLAVKEERPDVRRAALAALGQSGSRESVEVLGRAMADKDPQVRATAVVALAQIGGPDAEQSLKQAAASDDRQLRSSVAYSLGQLGTPTALAELQRLTTDSEPSVASSALQALARASPELAQKSIADRLSSDNAEVRRRAVSALNSLEPEAGRALYLAAARDSDPQVVETALYGLVRLGGREAAQALIDILRSDRGRDLKVSAADALERMGGKMALDHRDLIERARTAPPPAEAEPADNSG